MTTMTEETVAQYRGLIIIEWPPPVGSGPHGAIDGWKVVITDALTGKPVTTCSRADVVVHADVNDLVTADLTLFADGDGQPLLDGKPVEKDGKFLTGVFPFLVAEMRVQADGTRSLNEMRAAVGEPPVLLAEMSQ
jgi:hypothetical protein